MGRRAPKHDFMPDVHVFPGGRVDPRDARSEVESELRSEVAAPLEKRWSSSRARALGVAALRETFEETGLVIGRRRGDDFLPALGRLNYVARAITPADSPKRFHARFFVVEYDSAFGEPQDSSELLDLSWLEFKDALALPIIDVTGFVLRAVEDALARPQQAPRALFIRYRNEVPVVSLEPAED